MERSGVSLFVLCLLALALMGPSQCSSASREGLPQGSPFSASPNPAAILAEGVAAGDVESDKALIWLRTSTPSAVLVDWREDGTSDMENGETSGEIEIHTEPETDLIARVTIEGLTPSTAYRYTVRTRSGSEPGTSPLTELQTASGRFRTAPLPDQREPVTFVWSGDLGGQGRCRRPGKTYGIFDAMRGVDPRFAILVGDLAYTDNRCAAPPNFAGSDFKAATLDEFRRKHRYHRGDQALRRFLAEVPVYAIWDDHEVRNNFAGSNEPLMPLGRQAFVEYWPVATPPDDPHRLYRRVRYGADLDLFILDTRQYRSPNSQRDGPEKTMLGTAQREWLLAGLKDSTATWKVLVTSVPLSTRKSGSALVRGNDSWARAWDGTGFLSELRQIVDFLLAHQVRNVVWLSGDVHFTQVNAYDPDGDGVPDFHEFIAGPLSASSKGPKSPEADLRPTTLYSDGKFSNFGAITIDGSTLRLRILDEDGRTRFENRIAAR